MEVNKILPRS